MNDKGGKFPPFISFAPKYWELGLPVFPLKPNSKIPAVTGWNKLVSQPSANVQTRWLSQHAEGNLGLVLGKGSGFTVVDSDEPDQLAACLDEFGPTELVVYTASGKHHLYYRWNGEERLLRLYGRKLDLLGAGYVVLPPSVVGEGTYRFGQSSLFDQPELGIVNRDAISGRGADNAFLSACVHEGQRNQVMFTAVRGAYFQGFHTYEQLLGEADKFNSAMIPPLPSRELRATVRSVLKYAWSGTLVPPGINYGLIWEQSAFSLSGNALKLLLWLRKMHSGLRDQFNIPVKFTANALQVSHKTVMDAIEELIADRWIDRLHKGGKGVGDPSLYKFLEGWKK